MEEFGWQYVVCSNSTLSLPCGIWNLKWCSVFLIFNCFGTQSFLWLLTPQPASGLYPSPYLLHIMSVSNFWKPRWYFVLFNNTSLSETRETLNSNIRLFLLVIVGIRTFWHNSTFCICTNSCIYFDYINSGVSCWENKCLLMLIRLEVMV